MKVAICQTGDAKSAEEMSLTDSLHRRACENFGYDYLRNIGYLDSARHAYWQKVVMLRDVMASAKYDYLIWLDGDAVWLGEEPITPRVGMVGATRHWHYERDSVDCYNCGVLYWQCSDEALAALELWLATSDENHGWHDQWSFNKLVRAGSIRITELPHRFNAVVDNPAYTDGHRPIVAAWHGVPERLQRMSDWIRHEIMLKSPENLLLSWDCRQQLRRLIELLNARVVVEVGVYRGEFLAQLSAAHVRDCIFHGVDAWTMSPDYDGYSDALANSDLLEKAERIARRRFAGNSRIKLEKGDSLQAVSSFPKSSADLVYIDANHSYDRVRSDLQGWYPVVRPGGVLAGHDYCRHFPGVIDAVNEFTRTEDLQLYLTTREEYASWAVIKPIHSNVLGLSEYPR